MASRETLLAEHRPEAVRAAREPRRSYLADAVLGAIDAASRRSRWWREQRARRFRAPSSSFLSVANLAADGFSMAVSNYQGTKTERESLERAAREEEEHIRVYPEGEREEIRQIFAAKGFAGPTLERIVEVISSNRGVWVDTMLTEERGLQPKGADPLRAGIATFGAFAVAGLIPLLPFLSPWKMPLDGFAVSAAITAAAFFGIGNARGLIVDRSTLRTGIETLLTGGAAATLAFAAAWLLRGLA